MLLAGEVILDDVAVNFARINGKCLELDMNQAFYTQLTSMGTTGEKMLVGSLVNTFLSAYGTETVMLTVDRQIIDSGHIVYGEPLGYFE
jgi:calcineurin-like phosphoesterase